MNFDAGRRYSLSVQTGVMAAALAANSPIFYMRLSAAAQVRARIDRARVQFNTIAAFTTPITAGRGLEMRRGSAGFYGGGTQIVDIGKRLATVADSQFDDAFSGDVRIATTAALTGTPPVENIPLRLMSLVQAGAAGAFIDREYLMRPSECDEMVLTPGEFVVIRNTAAMDAGGTFQLTVEVDWREVAIIT